ncbi:MAG: metallophosphoesterase family protein [Chitinophagaceae bacterium]
MKATFITCRVTALLFFLTIASQLRADTTYVKFGALWKFLDKGSAPPADWRELSFNDGNWKNGLAEFGYGTNRERTTVNFGNNPNAKYITTYFRRAISIADVTAYGSIRLNAYIDDGAIIYVNGTEVARMNINGKPGYATLAAAAEDNGNTLSVFEIPAASFTNGKNIIAVEVHQSAAGSSDLSFDLEVIALPAAVAGNGQPPAEPAITRGPFLQMVSGNAVTIKWTTAAPTTSRIKYGNSENNLGAVITDRKTVTEHEMRITGLKPDIKYYYAVGSRNSIVKGSYRNYFTTAPPATTKRKIRIGVFGDPGTGNALQKSSRDNYLKIKGGYNNAEMVIMLGDNAYNNGTEEEHNGRFFNIYNNNVFDNNVIFPVPGNHEYANNRERALDHNIPYYNIFTVPTKGESGGLPSGTEHYYSYDYGNIHFIMLDSYGIDAGNHLYDDTTSGQQAVWLKADLAANSGKHKWTIACLHHPPYTNGSHVSDAEQDLIAIRRKITPILERYGVDVVLAGHSHVYERSFLVKDHIGFSDAFNKGSVPGGVAVSLSNARYDGSAGNKASADTSASTSSCPYFTIDSIYKHGTVYVVAGSAGQVNANNTNTYPVFYTRNQSKSNGGETGALYLEIEDNRLDAKFIGSSGTVRDQFTIMKGVNRNTVITTTINKPAVLAASWIGGYNWLADAGAPAIIAGNLRTLSVKPPAAGNYTYYVSDSIGTKTTCLADTFKLQVISSMAASVRQYKALLIKENVLVRWTSTRQENSEYFSIDRSINGVDFETLMVMDAENKSGIAAMYEFIDKHPLPGASYYRLSAIDKNNARTEVGISTVWNDNPVIQAASTPIGITAGGMR